VDCSAVKDDCCTGISEGTCDPDCTKSADTDCDDCTASQGDCCYPSNDAICDSDCPTGMDPDCASNSCQNMGNCEIGKPCIDHSQCSSLFCSNKKCVQATCNDDMKNGKESDKDCGGSCIKCGDDKNCNEDSDCESNYCAYGTCNSDTCFDKKLSGSETDVDCGGACPTKCSEGSYCDSNEDCVSGTECYLEKCTVCSAENNQCGTETGSADSDGDGMPDEWELQHVFDPTDPSDASGDEDKDGLTNLDEYKTKTKWGRSTDPNKIDTDGDGYSDKAEIDAGTNPLDADDKPKSKIWIILLMLFGGVLVGGLGFVAYHQITAKSEEQVRPIGGQIPRFRRVPATPAMPRAPAKKIVSEQTSRIKDMRKKRAEERANKRRKAFAAFGEEKAVEGKEKGTIKKGIGPADSIKQKKGHPRKKSKQDIFVRLSREVTKVQTKEGKPTKKRESRVTKKLKKIAKKKK